MAGEICSQGKKMKTNITGKIAQIRQRVVSEPMEGAIATEEIRDRRAAWK